MEPVAEAERIKHRLRECKNRDELEKVANEERSTYEKLREGDGFGPVMALQIQNLKAYMVKVRFKSA